MAITHRKLPTTSFEAARAIYNLHFLQIFTTIPGHLSLTIIHPAGSMAQPLPDWLKPVTLRYQNSDQVTTGLVVLPITYSGPSIPLDWPYTSVPTNPLTASPAASSAVPSPQIVSFLDGSGPFTVIGDVILTAAIPTQTASSAAIASSPPSVATALPAAPSPSVILVSTIVVAQPTANTTQSSSENTNSPTYNPLALGFVFLLTIIIILIIAATIILIRRQRRRRKLVRAADKYDSTPQEVHYEFNSPLYPQHHDGSQSRPHYLRNSRERETPRVTRQHEQVCMGDDRKEKAMPPLQTEFLLTPQREPAPSDQKWARLKSLVPKLSLFRGKKIHRTETVYHQPLPQTTPIYVNPYHDPSVNTNTGERVSRWRMGCGSLSSSALKLPSTIKSYHNEVPPNNDMFEQITPVKDAGLANNPLSAISANQRSEDPPVFSYNQSSTVSGPNGKPTNRAYHAIQGSPPTSPLKAKSMEAVYTLLELTSARRGVANPPLLKSKKSIIPSGLFKAQPYQSRSFGTRTKSSRGTGKGSNSKRYSDHSPPLLVAEAECEDEASDTDGDDDDRTDPGDSPLDFITIPLRSPPRCRRGTTPSSAAFTGIDNSVDSIGGPRSLPPPSPIVPLSSSAKKVRPKKFNFPALAHPSAQSQPSTSNSSDDHAAPLRRVPYPSSNSALLPSLPIAGTLLLKKQGENSPTSSPQLRRAHHQSFGPAVMNDLSGNGSSLGTNMGHEAHRLDKSGNSKDIGDGFLDSSSRVSIEYPKDPSLGTSEGSISVFKPEAAETKISSEEAHNSTGDENIVFNGYFGSGSIGNTGGVSELGILDNSMHGTDRSMSCAIEEDDGFPASVHHYSGRQSLVDGSSQQVDSDEYSYTAADLFAAKPPVGGHVNSPSESSGMTTHHVKIDIRSPLERIAEKCRQPHESSEGEDRRIYGMRSDESQSQPEGEDDEGTEESCRLLYAQPALSSRCSRATLGQRLVPMRTNVDAEQTKSHHASVISSGLPPIQSLDK
ncbi:hypothetical protein MJO28_014997 [Puccinia striiformis f. sp. tritici]|uniref:Uncharacterized protein n=1 Tax=Puccinia striiformis f. sp. tritici TaxID=168172 RepID=A0ACC0DRH1_9BASI|nr:hypothetical protein MJO28_014997 [Puccinia striiformis f. sp. tritici]